MRPLGQTRPLLAYGVPAAAGLAIGGALSAQGEDPGSAILGGAAAALGARGGLGAARLAGKYGLNLAQEKAVIPLGNIVGDIGRNIPTESKVRSKVAGKAADIIAAAEGAAITPGAQQLVGKLSAGLGVPAAAGLGGLGGVALGAIPGALGVPGFQQGMGIDPEAPGSSNTTNAKYGVSSYATTQYV